MSDILTIFRAFVDEMNLPRNRRRGLAEAASDLLNMIERTQCVLRIPTDLEELIRSSKAGKEKKRDAVLEFYQYYKMNTGENVETDLRNKTIIDDQTKRRIALVQFLQNNKCATREIANQFMMSDRMIRDDLKALEDGIRVNGKELRVNIKNTGWEKSMSYSCHPIFLNLTLEEVVSMTAGLMDVAEKEPLYGSHFRKIAREVYTNLTPYAKGRIQRLLDTKGMLEYFSDEVAAYESQLTTEIITMLKSECFGQVQIRKDDLDYIFSDCRIVAYEDGEIQILTEDNRRLSFPVSTVFACESYLTRTFDN